MGKGSKSQDNSPMFMALMMAQMATSAQNQKTGADQLAWAKQQDALDRAQSQPILDLQLKAQQEALANAQKDRARYEAIYQPLENQYVQQASTWDTPEEEQNAAGRAAAVGNQIFEAQRSAATRDLEAFGVDPSATRFAGLDIGARTANAAALAGAENSAINQRIQEGLALRGNAINIGRGLPGQSLAGLGAGVGAGSAGLSGITGLTSLGANTMGTGLQWANLGQQGLNEAGVIGNNYAQNQLGRDQLAAGASSGWGSLAGLLGGSILGGRNDQGGTLGGSIGSGLLRGATALGGIFGLDEGGAIPDPNNPPQIQGAVPITASPTQGRAIDDVPARLSPGEFVVPKDVVMWQGEKHFQNLIKKSREQKNDPQQAPAKPEMKAIPTAPVAPRMAYAGGGRVKGKPYDRRADELSRLPYHGIPESEIQPDPSNPLYQGRLRNGSTVYGSAPQYPHPAYPWTQISPKVDSHSNMPQVTPDMLSAQRRRAVGAPVSYDEQGRAYPGLTPDDALSAYSDRPNIYNGTDSGPNPTRYLPPRPQPGEADTDQPYASWVYDAMRGGS
jgi:hypothetical protein